MLAGLFHHPPLISKHQEHALSDSQSPGTEGFSLKEWSGSWNEFPREVVESPPLEELKRPLAVVLGVWFRGDCGGGRFMVGLDLEGLFQP